MYGHYGYPHYGQAPSAGAIAGGATAASTQTSSHMDPKGFMGLNWTSIMIAVTIGSLTAVLTQLTLEYVKERKKQGKKLTHQALTFSRPWERK